MAEKIKRIGVLTSGGDAPGMNAAIRAAVLTAIHFGGVRGNWRAIRVLSAAICSLGGHVAGISKHGGTMLYTARSEEFMTRRGRISPPTTAASWG